MSWAGPSVLWPSPRSRRPQAASEGAGPVHDAVVTFASGRQLGLVSYEKHSRQIPETEICGADGAVCFPAY